MTPAIWTLLGTVAALALAGFTWYVKNAPRTRIEELNKEIMRLEDDQRIALSKHDMERVARNNLSLKRLRDIQTALAGK